MNNITAVFTPSGSSGKQAFRRSAARACNLAAICLLGSLFIVNLNAFIRIARKRKSEENIKIVAIVPGRNCLFRQIVESTELLKWKVIFRLWKKIGYSCSRKEERCVCVGSEHCFCCPNKESKRLKVNFQLIFFTYNDQILCSSDPPDRHNWGFFSCRFWFFFSWVWRKRQDECKCSCLIYQVDMKFTKAIFDCEGLLELKKIRHPTCTLF